MENIRQLIESEKSSAEVFSAMTEAKSKPGNVPVVDDYLRMLEDTGGFLQGDVVQVKTIVDTSEQKNYDKFKVSLESKEGKKGSMELEKDGMDKIFELVYER